MAEDKAAARERVLEFKAKFRQLVDEYEVTDCLTFFFVPFHEENGIRDGIAQIELKGNCLSQLRMLELVTSAVLQDVIENATPVTPTETAREEA